ncbi:MAG: hypothetical protein JXB88_13505 [Spirochaetales bacterium]|nr:hypothetical protein [Spirochaetales bacterium]
MGPVIMIVLFVILWILATLFQPIKDMIETRLSGSTGSLPEVTVKDESEGNKSADRQEKKKVTFNIYPKSGYCDVCSRMVKPHEAYLVPVDIFYDSEEYREYLKNHPKAKSIIASKGIDGYISEMKAQDKTEYSTICPDCIHMFEE